MRELLLGSLTAFDYEIFTIIVFHSHLEKAQFRASESHVLVTLSIFTQITVKRGGGKIKKKKKKNHVECKIFNIDTITVVIEISTKQFQLYQCY